MSVVSIAEFHRLYASRYHTFAQGQEQSSHVIAPEQQLLVWPSLPVAVCKSCCTVLICMVASSFVICRLNDKEAMEVTS